MNKSDEDIIRANLRKIGEYLIEFSGESKDVFEKIEGAYIFFGEGRGEFDFDDLPGLLDLAKREYIQRGKRKNYFNDKFFGEPAWDIILDLFVTQGAGYRVSVTAACIASQVPPTTALRWLTILEDEGIIRRKPDASDRRRDWLELTDFGMARLRAYLRSLQPRPRYTKNLTNSAPS